MAQRVRHTSVSELWLAQHTGKPSTVEGYESLLRHCVWPDLPLPAQTRPQTRPAARGAVRGDGNGTGAPRRVQLGSMLADEVTPADINTWVNALTAKPDARRKDAAVAVSASTINAALRVLRACLNWGVAHGYLDRNPALGIHVTVHGARQIEWFRTAEDFWAALAHIDQHWDGALHNPLVVCAYLGLRVNELAALQPADIDLPRGRVTIRHNLDNRRRPSTVKTARSETWLPLHPEATGALRDQLDRHTGPADAPLFTGPRGGVLGSTLLNDALAHGCTQARLGYRVTIHGLRHSVAN